MKIISALFLAATTASVAQTQTNNPPTDVAAVQITVPASHPCNITPNSNGGFAVPAVCITGPETRWTCPDMRRVLLTSEDGAKHCILFPPQEPEVITLQVKEKATDK